PHAARISIRFPIGCRPRRDDPVRHGTWRQRRIRATRRAARPGTYRRGWRWPSCQQPPRWVMSILKHRRAVLARLIVIVAASVAANSQTGATISMTAADQRSMTKDLVVARTFDAPVDQVWAHWVDSDRVKKWWSPTGFSVPVARMDFREGGTSLV